MTTEAMLDQLGQKLITLRSRILRGEATERAFGAWRASLRRHNDPQGAGQIADAEIAEMRALLEQVLVAMETSPPQRLSAIAPAHAGPLVDFLDVYMQAAGLSARALTAVKLLTHVASALPPHDKSRALVGRAFAKASANEMDAVAACVLLGFATYDREHFRHPETQLRVDLLLAHGRLPLAPELGHALLSSEMTDKPLAQPFHSRRRLAFALRATATCPVPDATAWLRLATTLLEDWAVEVWSAAAQALAAAPLDSLGAQTYSSFIQGKDQLLRRRAMAGLGALATTDPARAFDLFEQIVHGAGDLSDPHFCAAALCGVGALAEVDLERTRTLVTFACTRLPTSALIRANLASGLLEKADHDDSQAFRDWLTTLAEQLPPMNPGDLEGAISIARARRLLRRATNRPGNAVLTESRQLLTDLGVSDDVAELKGVDLIDRLVGELHACFEAGREAIAAGKPVQRVALLWDVTEILCIERGLEGELALLVSTKEERSSRKNVVDQAMDTIRGAWSAARPQNAGLPSPVMLSLRRAVIDCLTSPAERLRLLEDLEAAGPKPHARYRRTLANSAKLVEATLSAAVPDAVIAATSFRLGVSGLALHLARPAEPGPLKDAQRRIEEACEVPGTLGSALGLFGAFKPAGIESALSGALAAAGDLAYCARSAPFCAFDGRRCPCRTGASGAVAPSAFTPPQMLSALDVSWVTAGRQLRDAATGVVNLELTPLSQRRRALIHLLEQARTLRDSLDTSWPAKAGNVLLPRLDGCIALITDEEARMRELEFRSGIRDAAWASATLARWEAPGPAPSSFSSDFDERMAQQTRELLLAMSGAHLPPTATIGFTTLRLFSFLARHPYWDVSHTGVDRWLSEEGEPIHNWAKVKGLFIELEGELDKVPAGARRERIADLGRRLFEESPSVVQQLAGACASDHWLFDLSRDTADLPWEMLYADDFLCLTRAIGRRLRIRGARTPAPARREKGLRILVGDGVSNWEKEVSEIEQAAKITGDPVDVFDPGHSGRDGLAVFLRNGARILHVTAHSADSVERDGRFHLRGGLVVSASEFRELLGAAPPALSFLNSCRSLRGIAEDGSPAGALLASGSIVVGTLFRPEAGMAAQMAGHFYRALLAGATVGSALRAARRAIAAADETLSWACYALYGEPSARLPVFAAR